MILQVFSINLTPKSIKKFLWNKNKNYKKIQSFKACGVDLQLAKAAFQSL